MVSLVPALPVKRNQERFKPVRMPSVVSTTSAPLSRTVLLVEQDDEHRDAVRAVLVRAGYEVLAARTLTEARRLIRSTADVHAAIIEFALPDGIAPELIAALIEHRPLCRSIVLTDDVDRDVISRSARAGAHAHLRRPSSIADMLDAVSRTVRSTLEWRRATATGTGAEGLSVDEPPPPVALDMQAAVARIRYIAQLSPAETVTMWRLLWGDSNKRMAELMGCTERTIKFYVAGVLARTGAPSRSALLRVLLEDANIHDPWDQRETWLGTPVEHATDVDRRS